MSEAKEAPAISSPDATSASKSLEKPRRARPEEFIFGKLIGEGSYSCVFLAREVSSQREFAIKVCEKRQIVQENKTEYIHREKDIMLLLSQFNEKKPYFVQLHSTFQVSLSVWIIFTSFQSSVHFYEKHKIRYICVLNIKQTLLCHNFWAMSKAHIDQDLMSSLASLCTISSKGICRWSLCDVLQFLFLNISVPQLRYYWNVLIIALLPKG